MRKVIFLVMAVSLSSFSFADERDTRIEIRRAAHRIDRLVQNRNYSEQTLRQARSHIFQALASLSNNQPPITKAQCIDWSYEEYKRSYGSNSALRKAKDLCDRVRYYDTLFFFYPFYKKSYSVSSSLDKAADLGNVDAIFDIEPLLRKILVELSNTYTTSSAIDKAFDFRNGLRKIEESCFNRFYDQYQRSYSTMTAIRKTIDFCEDYYE